MPITPVAEASGSKSRVVSAVVPTGAASPRPAEPSPFLAVSEDLVGLILSSVLTPSVRTRDSMQKLLPTWIIALALQIAFIAYMCDYVWTSASVNSICNTPFLLQLCAVYIFGATQFANHSSLANIDLALHCDHFKKADSDEVKPTVELSRGERMRLAAVPALDLAIEVTVTVIGTLFLLTSENSGEVVLNSVAVNFISDIDETMLSAFVSPLSKQRLAKYRFESRAGVEEGVTVLSGANAATRRRAHLSKWLPLLWLAGSILIVLVAYAVALSRPGTAHTCSFITPSAVTPS